MIAQLSGKVVDISEKSIILDVGGVGYGVQVANGYSLELTVGQDVVMTTYHHIKENVNELFGFNSQEAKNLFEMLIGVSGVGPKSALAIMSLGPQDKIRQAISSDNSNYLSAAAGVGTRSAQRICIELKDKVMDSADFTMTEDINDDALDALLTLGYNRQQAVRALAKVDRTKSGEEQVKQALKGLS